MDSSYITGIIVHRHIHGRRHSAQDTVGKGKRWRKVCHEITERTLASVYQNHVCFQNNLLFLLWTHHHQRKIRERQLVKGELPPLLKGEGRPSISVHIKLRSHHVNGTELNSSSEHACKPMGASTSHELQFANSSVNSPTGTRAQNYAT